MVRCEKADLSPPQVVEGEEFANDRPTILPRSDCRRLEGGMRSL